MGVIRPRREGASLSTSLAVQRRDQEQQRRQRIDIPKPLPPAAPTGGGIVGMAEIRSTSGSVIMRAGAIEMDYASITYDAPTDPNAGGGGASTPSWATLDGHRIILDPGWYIPVLTLAVIWSAGGAPPDFGGPYMNGGWDAAHNDRPIYPLTQMSGGESGLVQTVNFGPTYMQSGSDLHAELRPLNGAPTSDSDPVHSYANWNITKFG